VDFLPVLSRFDLEALGGKTFRWLGRQGKLLDLCRRVAFRSTIEAHKRLLKTGKTSTIIPVGGFQMKLDLTELQDFVVYQEYVTGQGYEAGTRELVRSKLSRGDCFIDVGANSGYFVLTAAGKVGKSGKILAFEPNPTARKRLVSNVTSNDLDNIVQVRAEALADHVGSLQMYLSRVADGMASVVPRGRKGLEVQCTTLDDALSGETPHLMKMDIEGAELAALKGASNTLSRVRALELIIEWNPLYAGKELWDLISQGSKVCEITGDEPRLRELSPDRLPFGGSNLLVTRNETRSPQHYTAVA
jgi:FkbM family methyltransferase